MFCRVSFSIFSECCATVLYCKPKPNSKNDDDDRQCAAFAAWNQWKVQRCGFWSPYILLYISNIIKNSNDHWNLLCIHFLQTHTHTHATHVVCVDSRKKRKYKIASQAIVWVLCCNLQYVFEITYITTYPSISVPVTIPESLI